MFASPANDQFASRTVASGDVLSARVVTTGASSEPVEPAHAGGPARASLWWQWTPATSGTAVLDTAGTDFDTVLAVYRGDTLATLAPVASCDDAGLAATSEVAFSVRANTPYLIAVDGFAGGTGDLVLNGRVYPGDTVLTASFSDVAPGVDGLDSHDGWQGMFSEGVTGISRDITGNGGFIGRARPMGNAVAVWKPVHFDPVREGRSQVHVEMDLLVSGPAPAAAGGYFVLLYDFDGDLLASLEFDLGSRTIVRHNGDGRTTTPIAFSVGVVETLTWEIDFAANSWTASYGGKTLFAHARFQAGDEACDLGSLAFAWTGSDPDAVSGTSFAFGNLEIAATPNTGEVPANLALANVVAAKDGVQVTWTGRAGASGYDIWRGTSLEDAVLAGTSSTNSFLDAGVSVEDDFTYWIFAADGTAIAAWNPGVDSAGQLIDNITNLSARAQVSSARHFIVGFTLKGTGVRPVLLRAIGPGLKAFGVNDPLPEPRLQLHGGQLSPSPVLAGPGWSQEADAAELPGVMADAGAFALAPGSQDSVLFMSLPAGVYSAVIDDATGGAGTALGELYVVGPPGPRLVNISTRSEVRAGAGNLIGGLVVTGYGSQRFLIRGVGPTLEKMGVADFLPDPVIAVYQNGKAQPIGTNDSWSSGGSGHVTEIRAAEDAARAFPLPEGSLDAAMILELPSGLYTVTLGPAPNTASGEGLLEIYHLD